MNYSRLLAPDRGVPGGYRYLDTDTGFLTKANTLHELIAAATKHRTANGLTIPSDFPAIIETQLCNNLPPNYCVYVSGSGPDAQHCVVSAEEALKGAEAISMLVLANLIGRDVFVEQAEADRRASICLKCPKHTSISGCQTCGFMSPLKELVVKLRGGRKLQYDDDVQACCICGCWLKLTAWVKLEYLRRGVTPEQDARRPDHCWYRQ